MPRSSVASILLGLLLLSGCARSLAQKEVDAATDMTTSPIDGARDAATSADASSTLDAALAQQHQDAAMPLHADAGGDDASTPPCVTEGSCAAPTMLGSVSGDTGADVLSATGMGPAFLAAHVTEDDHGLLGVDLQVHATLKSPPGSNFDLVLYGEQDECATASDTAATEFMDIVDFKWSDGRGSDSGRTVVFEVRSKAGHCPSLTPWTLEVRGN